MIDWLKKEWYGLVLNYCDDILAQTLWNEIETKYTSKSRYYHNLTHLYNMLLHAEDYKAEINNLNTFKFAVWYHDIIYKPSRKDNEEKSALFAEKRLKSIHFNEKQTKIVQKLIISTKKHELILKENNDNSYLLDLDLSILGTEWITYELYIKNIRKEYKIYPSILYNPGRKKVLSHFLKRETLYFTEVFKNKYENQARENLKKEIELL